MLRVISTLRNSSGILRTTNKMMLDSQVRASVIATPPWYANTRLLSTKANDNVIDIVRGNDEIMLEKKNGSCNSAPKKDLRWGIDSRLANGICCFNRHFAEPSGYFGNITLFFDELKNNQGKELTFYDSVTEKPLFIAPRGRSAEEFLQESLHHGWPSFRIGEVVWENVRILNDGECVSVDGTHLGHDIPDKKGHRFCINLCSIAGKPKPKN